MRKGIKIGLTTCFSILTILLLVTTIYRWTWDYNEMGNHFDQDSATNYDVDGIIGYGILTIIFSIPTIILLLSLRKVSDLEKIHIEYFKKTFDRLGLRKYESSNGHGGGGWIKFKNNAFRLQLLDDRGLIETDISPLFGQEQFRGIEAYNSLLTLKNSQDKLSDSEKRKILGTRLDYNSQAAFLTDNYDNLKNLLRKDNYLKTLEEVENVGRERYNR